MNFRDQQGFAALSDNDSPSRFDRESFGLSPNRAATAVSKMLSAKQSPLRHDGILRPEDELPDDYF